LPAEPADTDQPAQQPAKFVKQIISLKDAKTCYEFLKDKNKKTLNKNLSDISL